MVSGCRARAASAGATPSTGYTTGAADRPAGYSWIVKTLPYMDEANLYNSISQRFGKIHGRRFHPLHRTVAGTNAAFAVTYTSGGTTIGQAFRHGSIGRSYCPSFAGTPPCRRLALRQLGRAPAYTDR